MAKTKTLERSTKESSKRNKMSNGRQRSNELPEQLYEAALTLVEQSQPDEALRKAKQLWAQIQNGGVSQTLPALNLLGEISVELGAVDAAREYFQEAVTLDPNGKVPESMGGGAEKFLWLAQLCEAGGKESVEWFERGIAALQVEIAALDAGEATAGSNEDALLLMRVEKKKKLANALCGIVEIYMTDLSWEDDAETRCETLITEAIAMEDETSPEVLQTLASVRLSQERTEDARAALRRSLGLWSDLDPEDDAVPDFATKISLSRLLMEASMEAEAMQVLNRLVLEDDQSVEAWYLGGWCQYLITERSKAGGQDGKNGNAEDVFEDLEVTMKGSRHWLKTAIKLYEALDYEDVRLLDHAQELVTELDAVLGPEDEQAEAEEDQYGEWNGLDDGDDSDDEMKDV